MTARARAVLRLAARGAAVAAGACGLPAAAAVPPPAVAQAASAADKPSAKVCDSERRLDLYEKSPKFIIQQIQKTTPLISEKTDTFLVVNKPGDGKDLRFRVLIAPRGRGGPVLDRARELAVSGTQALDDETARNLGIDKPQDWARIRFTEPGAVPLDAALRSMGPSPYKLTVLACSDSQELVGRGDLDIAFTSFWLSAARAVLLVVVIYLALVTFTWSARRAAAKPTEPPPPQRLRPVDPIKWWRCLDPVVLAADRFDRGSLSKLQVLVFTLLIVFEVTLLLLRTGTLTELSPTIVLLLGLPALGALGTGAATVTRDRISSENWSWLVSRGVLPVNDRGGGVPRWKDLFVEDGELDFYKVQAAAFSIVVAMAILIRGESELGKFAVPETLLQILGLSQVVLVGGRLVKPRTVGELDDLITELRKRGDALQDANRTSRDVDAQGVPLATPSLTPGPYADMEAAGQAGAIPVAVRRYCTLVDEVAVLLASVSHSPVARSRLAPQL